MRAGQRYIFCYLCDHMMGVPHVLFKHPERPEEVFMICKQCDNRLHQDEDRICDAVDAVLAVNGE